MGVLLGALVALGACDCEKMFCREIQVLRGVMMTRITNCCALPPSMVPDCIVEVDAWFATVTAKAQQALHACREGNQQLAKQLIEEIRRLIESVPPKLLGDGWVNSLPVLLTDEYVMFSITATTCATVGADERRPDGPTGSLQTGTGKDRDPDARSRSESPATASRRTYCIDPGSFIHARIVGSPISLPVDGLVTFDAAGALVEIHLLISTPVGLIEATGPATAPDAGDAAPAPSDSGGALLLELSGSGLTALGYGSTYPVVAISLPIDASQAPDTLTLMSGWLSGTEVFPVDFLVEAAMKAPSVDVPQRAGQFDPCGDANGNALPDLVDTHLKLLESLHDCR